MMAITLASINQMDQHDDRNFGTVIHRDSQMNAVIVGPFERLLDLIGCEVTAEYELTTIDAVEIDLPEDDENSGIYAADSERVIIDGRVHMITEIDENFAYIDVYIQNGADFLSITTDDVPRLPRLDSRIRIKGHGLTVFPTFT